MRTVTCSTDECMNGGIPLDVPDDGTPVLCGPCGNWIIPPSTEPVMEPEQEEESDD